MLRMASPVGSGLARISPISQCAPAERYFLQGAVESSFRVANDSEIGSIAGHKGVLRYLSGCGRVNRGR